jgi:prepilin-type N-terminal cleavage/methylation domain-containing protein
MKPTIQSDRAFTLIELLVVIAIIGILAALLLPVLSAVKGNAKRTACLNNLREINQGIRMYYDDSNGASPTAYHSQGTPMVAYRRRMMNYVGLKGRSSPQDMIFACPADTFHYHDPRFNGGLYFGPMSLCMIARTTCVTIIRVIGSME